MSITIVLGALALAAPARAVVVDVSFSGAFTQYNSACQNILPPPGSCTTTTISTPFSATFSYVTGNPYLINGVTLTSSAFASLLGLPATIHGADGPSSYVRLYQTGDTVHFDNLLDSQFGANLANLQLFYPPSAGETLSAPLPPLGAGSATFNFYTSQSPGGSGPSLNGTVSSFVAAERVSAVPEVGAWAMMLAGVGLAGGALRRRARAGAQARV